MKLDNFLNVFVSQRMEDNDFMNTIQKFRIKF